MLDISSLFPGPQNPIDYYAFSDLPRLGYAVFTEQIKFHNNIVGIIPGGRNCLDIPLYPAAHQGMESADFG